MSNLTVENLSHIVNTGDVERLMGRSEAVTDARVAREAPELVKETGGKTFSDTLRDSVDKVNQDQLEANTAIKELVAGRNKNIHETMLAVERADTSLKLMMQVRNKVLDAYREIMRMQV